MEIPTPPPAPLASRVEPADRLSTRSASCAVPAATGSAAASSGDTVSGRCAANEAVTIACSAQPPTIPGQPPNTSSPTTNPVTPGPTATTIPATSRPSTAGPVVP